MNPTRKTPSVLLALLLLSFSAFAAGLTDRSFGINGSVTVSIAPQSRVIDVLALPDGKLLAVAQDDGHFLYLVRYLPNGTLDTTLDGDGIRLLPSTDFTINDAELQGDGKIVLTGTYKPYIDSTVTDFLMIRLAPDGTYDPTFGGTGIVTVNQGSSDQFYKLDIQTDGKIVAAGSTSDAGGREAVFRFTTNGALDASFGGGGFYFYSYPPFGPTNQYSYGHWYYVVAMADGRVLTGNSYYGAEGGRLVVGYTLHMLDRFGVPDTGFGSNGRLSTSPTVVVSGNDGLGFDELADGNICIADHSGVFVFDRNGIFVRRLPFEGGRVEALSNGAFLVSGARNGIGDFRVYSENTIVGKGVDAGQPFAAADGKIVTARVDSVSGSLIVKRYSRLSSQGTLSVDLDKDEKADLAFQRGTALFASKSSGGASIDIQLPAGSQVISGLFDFFDPQLVRLDRMRISTYVRGTSGGAVGKYWLVSTIGGINFSSDWGIAGDIPVGGDFNGNGTTDSTVFRPGDGIWYSAIGPRYVRWGTAGDKPVPADYDYDGITDYAVYRPSTGTWWVQKSSDGGTIAFNFGLSTDIPLTGDYDGDGRADFTVYRPSEGNWYQYLTTEGFRVTRFGLAADLPVPGDYDGDGRHDIALYRSGIWYLLKSTEGFAAVTLPNVLPTDVPVTVRYDQ